MNALIYFTNNANTKRRNRNKPVLQFVLPAGHAKLTKVRHLIDAAAAKAKAMPLTKPFWKRPKNWTGEYPPKNWR